MITIDTFSGFEIRFSEQSDGDFRDMSLVPLIHRPYPQIHGTRVHTITGENRDEPFWDCDGVYTRVEDIWIGCLTADCPIIILMGMSECAVIHSGWRGTRAHIVLEWLSYFSTKKPEIRAYIWPHIQKDSYTVGNEFTEYFDPKYLTPHGEKYRLDLASLIRDDLIDSGIIFSNIHISPIDTYTTPSLQSYRHDPSSGRGIVSVKMISNN